MADDLFQIVPSSRSSGNNCFSFMKMEQPGPNPGSPLAISPHRMGAGSAMIRGLPTSTYHEQPPSAAPAGHVLCLWSQVIGPGDRFYRHRVLPDGCADVVWIGDAPAAVAGPATGPVMVPLAPRTIVVGVRLRPGAAPGLLGLPASELLDRDTPLRDLWGPAADRLSSQVTDETSIAARLAAAEAGLAARLAEAPPLDPMIAAATRWLARRPDGRVGELARVLEVGERRLRRRFALAVGYGPKTFQRVLRLQRVLALSGRARPRLRVSLADARRRGRICRSGAHEPRASEAHRPQPTRRPARLASTLELSDLFKTDTAPAAIRR